MRIRFLRLLLFIAFIACSLLRAAPSAVAIEPEPDALSAHELLDRMAIAYADCKTYQDTGVVKTIFFQANGKRTINKPFSTAFIRPNLFRFEYRERRGDEDENRYLIWADGMQVQTWWDVKPGINQKESLNLALNAAAGVSGRSSHTVPALLLPDQIQGKAILSMTGIKRIADAQLADVDCYRVEGKYANAPHTLWLDKKKFLLRRIDSQHTFPNFRTEATTTYDPIIDGPIAENLLAFDPPQ